MYNDEPIVKIFTGPMFSSKTEQLIKEYIKWQIAGKNPVIYSPRINTRETNVKTRFGIEVKSIKINNLMDIIISGEQKAIFIDELHLFNEQNKHNVVEFVDKYINQNVSIVVAGLNLDFHLKPFEIMCNIMGKGTKIKVMKAICQYCHKDNAVYSKKLTNNENRIDIDSGQYIPVCHKCYNI